MNFRTSLFTVTLHFMELSHFTSSIVNTCTHTEFKVREFHWCDVDEKVPSKTFLESHFNTPLVYATEVIYQVEDMNAQVTKWENACEKQLAILHDDNLLRANAHLNIPSNTSQIVASDKYGLQNSSWLILSLQAHEHISSLIRFIAAFMGLVFTITIRFSGVRCHQNSVPNLVHFCWFVWTQVKDWWEDGKMKNRK